MTIRGRATGPASQPLSGAQVSALLTDARRITTRTDSGGRYSLQVPLHDSLYLVRVALIGFVPRQRAVRLETGAPPTITLDFALDASVVALDEVRTVARRLRPARDEDGVIRSPGQTRALLDVSNGLSGDLTGNIEAALGRIPGVLSIPGANGVRVTSVFGLGTASNGITLNGTDIEIFTLPRDGLLRQVRMATYDPKYGRYSGLQVATSLQCGCLNPTRLLHLTVEEPAVRTNLPHEGDGRTVTRSVIASGSASDAISADRSYYNIAFQLAHQSTSLPTLFTLSASSLTNLGVSADSIARLASLASGLRLPLGSLAPVQASANTASAIARIDFSNSPLQNAAIELFTRPAIYMLAAASVSRSGGLGLRALGSAEQESRAGRDEGQLMFVYAPYLFDALSETKASIAVSRNSNGGITSIPSASVSLLSSAATSNVVSLGGSDAGNAAERRTSLQVTNETLWTSGNGAHRFQVYTDAGISHSELEENGNPYGRFVFNSLGDLQAGTPAAFWRVISAQHTAGSVVQVALGVSDVFRVRGETPVNAPSSPDGLTIQYGARIEAQRFPFRPALNGAVEGSFGRRTDQVPNSTAIAPMMGFTWANGTYREDMTDGAWYSSERHLVTGGIREYRSVLAPTTVYRVAQSTGLPGALGEVQCAGPATPRPDWSAYLASTAFIPVACAGSSPPAFTQTAPSVSLFSPSFDAAHSWRAEFNWRLRVSGQWYLVTGSSYSLNAGIPERFDLNFDGRQKFLLGDEGMRPVYVDPGSIDPRTGAMTQAGSRQFGNFSGVTELRSDGRSQQHQTSIGAEYHLGRTVASTRASNGNSITGVLQVNYTNADGRTSLSGFSASSEGDPRTRKWEPLGLPRHTIQATITADRPGWLSLGASVVLSSGIRFTPMVSADINGDGYANDRAFLFARPGNPSGPDLTSFLAQLSAEGGRCLREQLGRVAAPNSCIGPWSASLGTLTLTLDSDRLGLGNRGTVSLVVNNALAGVDRLLHGNTHAHGWGQGAYPDPVLLDVRGFDAVNHRFQYAVNPRFGSTQTNAFLNIQPATLTLDFRVDLGMDRETRAIEDLMRFAEKNDLVGSPSSIAAFLIQTARPHTAVDIYQILRAGDSLRLTPAQRSELEQARAASSRTADSAYTVLASNIFANRGQYRGVALRDRWHSAIATAIRASMKAAHDARDTLTPDQLEWLRTHHLAAGLFYGDDVFARRLRDPLTYLR